MKRTAISMPKSSPAILVNLLIIVQALNIARRTSIRAVQTQTLQREDKRYSMARCNLSKALTIKTYHPAQAKNLSFPMSGLPLQKLYR